MNCRVGRAGGEAHRSATACAVGLAALDSTLRDFQFSASHPRSASLPATSLQGGDRKSAPALPMSHAGKLGSFAMSKTEWVEVKCLKFHR